MYTIDYVMMVIGSMVGVALFLGAAYLIFLMLISAWRYVGQSRIELVTGTNAAWSSAMRLVRGQQ